MKSRLHQKLLWYPRFLRSAQNLIAFRGFLLDSFPQRRGKNHPRILVEANPLASSHIAYAYLGNVLAEKHNATIAAFSTQSFRLSRLAHYLPAQTISWWRWFFNPFSLIYRAFGCSSYHYPVPTRDHKRKAFAVVRDLFDKKPSKSDLEEFAHAGVKIGDLIYDSLLKNHRLPTLDPESHIVREGFQLGLAELLFWNDFFTTEDVKGVVVSHANYTMAIPARVAFSRGIDSFEATLRRLYRLTNNRPIDSDFLDYPNLFGKLAENEQKRARSLARKRMNQRFSGEVGVDMHYSSASAFRQPGKTRVLSATNRPKILIAAHCFFDNPHCFGINLFPDFWEWLEFVGEFSESSECEWYLKSHPDVLPGNLEILGDFCNRYKNFRLLAAETSHHQIISEGISAALTVYGTIGFEYAALGVPVINASTNNPHIAYGFNYHPKNVAEYTILLKSIPHLAAISHENEIQEYYFMRHLYRQGNPYIRDLQKILESLGGYKSRFSPAIYSVFLSQVTSKRHSSTLKALRAFVDSGEHRLYFDQHPE